jgi:dTDP-4-amino-4,6-dideoxygalactose transaminase
VEGIVLAGATPRFADVDPRTLLLTPETLAAAITDRTTAVVVVHLYGQTVDVDAVGRVADAAGLAVIEDAAQAHGARYRGGRVGARGRAGCFSFYPGKNLGALGDGGAVVSDDPALVSRIRRLADHGRSEIDRYAHVVAGRNSRLDTLQAAVLLAKLPGLDEANLARRALVQRYRAGLPSWCVPVAVHPTAQSVHHLAVVQVPDRTAAIRALDDAGIGWGIHYPVPVHHQPAFARYAGERLPVAETAAERILSLPLFPTLTDDDVDRVCEALARG